MRGEALNGDLGSPFGNRALEIGALALSSTWFQTYTGEAQELVKSGLAAGCRFPVRPASCVNFPNSSSKHSGGDVELVSGDPDCLTPCCAVTHLLYRTAADMHTALRRAIGGNLGSNVEH